MNLPDTENYRMIVTADPEHPEVMCYGVQNIETGVVEYYDNLYPRTQQAMEGIQEKYDEMLARIAGQPQLELITTNDDEPVSH